jgi:hypothetical protein
MSKLKDANVEECLSRVKDLLDLVKVKEGDSELKEKKAMADKAVAHLYVLLRGIAEVLPGPCSGCIQTNGPRRNR